MTKTDRLTQKFGKEIAQGVFEPGEALPSEADLCERFSTSRNVLREVIKVLATKRLIDAQPHRGLFARARGEWNYLDADVLAWVLEKDPDPELISNLIEVRQLIEPTISRWAAERASAVDLVDIEANYKIMEKNRDNLAIFQEADIAFHKAILLATHNLVICQLSEAISALQRAIFDHTFLSGTQHMTLTIQEHADLLEAIRRQQPDTAEKASRTMVVRTAKRAQQRSLTQIEPLALATSSASDAM